MQKNEIGPLSDAINKNKFKHKAWKCKAPRRRHNGIPSGALHNHFMDMTQKALATKTNKQKRQLGLHQNKLLHRKGNNKWSEKATYGVGENIFKLYIWKELISKIYKELLQFNNKKTNNLIS